MGSAAALAVAVTLLPGIAVAAPPANDAFAAAQELSGTAASAPGTTVEATFEAGEPSHYTSGNGSVWYVWTAPLNSNLRLDTCASTGPTKFQVYRGSSLATLEEVEPTGGPHCEGAGLGDDRRFNVTAGTTYRIAVIEYVGDADFTLALSAPPAPANDYFLAAQGIGALPVSIDATTTDATLEPSEESYFGSPNDGQSVWYRWTAPDSTPIWIDNCGGFGVKLRLFTGAALDSLQPVDDTNANTPESPYGVDCHALYKLPDESYGEVREFQAKAGTTYRIQFLHDDDNQPTAFHLGMRDAHFDGSLSQTSSRKSVRKGRTVTYTVTLKNLGSLPMSPEIDLVTSKPHRLGRPVPASRYVSLTSSKGTCKRVIFFAVHRGAICDPGKVAPGATVTMTAKIRPSGPLTHWASIDYQRGGEAGDNRDDNPRNDASAVVTTKVTGGHHRPHKKHRH